MVNNADRPAHFLVVEDDEAQRELIRIALTKNHPNLTLTCVSDGEQALDYLRNAGRFKNARRPDIVLLDLKMPKVDGHEVLQKVKNDPALRAIPIVVLTTSANENDRRKAYQMHANSYLVKPIDYETFQNLMCDINHYWALWNEPAVT